ncbi:MAG: hypothetical protein ABII12_17960 [Planctomycetota bacterium]
MKTKWQLCQYASGNTGYYSYGPKGGDPNWLHRPVDYVSFCDACRFAVTTCNSWLNHVLPRPGLLSDNPSSLLPLTVRPSTAVAWKLLD